jgi:hypothetical protein
MNEVTTIGLEERPARPLQDHRRFLGIVGDDLALRRTPRSPRSTMVRARLGRDSKAKPPTAPRRAYSGASSGDRPQ